MKENSTFNISKVNIEELDSYSDETDEILTSLPSWIVRRGISLVVIFLFLVLGSSSFIQFPEIVKTSLKISSMNSPKRLYSKRNSKITKLVVSEGSKVMRNDPIAFLESAADHQDVLKFRIHLSKINKKIANGEVISSVDMPTWNIGELRSSYQSFYQQFLEYISTQGNGFYLKSRGFLLQDLIELRKLRGQIIDQKNIQELEYANIASEFEAYKKLFLKGVISNNEFKHQENKYLAAKYPLQQASSTLLNNNVSYASKKKELMTLDHTIMDQKAKFCEALNKIITETDLWLSEYILTAPVDGIVSYAGVVQENQSVDIGKEIFIISPSNSDFFGEIHIPQNNFGKVDLGQRVLIKLKSYPHEQFGYIGGNISYISSVAFRDSVFIGKVAFESFSATNQTHRKIVLKDGMLADAEIITEESTLLQRFIRSIFAVLNLEKGLK